MSDGCLLLSQAKSLSFDIRRVYDITEVKYKRLLPYIFGEIIRLHRIKNFFANRRENRIQKHFAQSFKFSGERMDLLKKIVEWRRAQLRNEAIGSLSDGFNTIEFCDTVYSRRFWGLDDHDYYLIEVEFTLESLVSSGELTKSHSHFHLAGKSLSSLSDFEAEANMALKSSRHDKAIRLLTYVIAGAAVLQSITAFADLSTKKSINSSTQEDLETKE